MKTSIYNWTFIKSFRRLIRTVVPLAFLMHYSNSTSAQSKPWPVPAASLSMKNPLTDNASTVKIGQTLYMNYCAPCHGKSGKGDGPAAAALNPKPANHTSAAIQADSDGSLFFKISEGRTPMPKYKPALTDTQRWALVRFIKTLGKKS
jgi:mono/diheme cytochrome c family protein